MPFAIAVLCHPAGAYACVVTALAGFVYAYHTRTFVPAFTAASAALLATLAFLQISLDPAGAVLLALGAAALQLEFLVPTYGALLLAGVAAAGTGSWLLLAASPAAGGSLTPALRAALAALGTALLLAAVVRGWRLRTLAVR
jgi:membrane-bound serine protease (ClpP class)